MADQPSNPLPPPPPPLEVPQGMPPPPPMPEMPAAQPAPEPTPAPVMPAPQPAPQAPPMSASADISTEEYVEAVIEERWADLEDDIRKIVEWKNRSDQRITQLSQQFDDLKDRFDKLHAALIGKIENYDKNILEVGAEIKAMEKVFSKVLPTFTDNVKQLDSITRRLTE